MNTWKKVILNCLGIITTILAFVVIYLVLYAQGSIRTLSIQTLTEFGVMTVLAISTKGFWYTSVENSVRTSAKYLDNKMTVLDALDKEVTDPQHFDKFIDNENIRNYNIYVTNHVANLTEQNFKLPVIIRFAHWWCKLLKIRTKSKRYYLNKYIIRVERRAMKLHKLSAANILTLCHTSDGLVDDRNTANKHKWAYFITSTVMSVAIMFALAIIGFTSKEDIDTNATLLKMLMYSVTIISSILQTILRAYMTVQYDDTLYFKKIMSIIDKYISFKASPILASKVNYLKEESNAELINKPCKQNQKLIDSTE